MKKANVTQTEYNVPLAQASADAVITQVIATPEKKKYHYTDEEMAVMCTWRHMNH